MVEPLEGCWSASVGATVSLRSVREACAVLACRAVKVSAPSASWVRLTLATSQRCDSWHWAVAEKPLGPVTVTCAPLLEQAPPKTRKATLARLTTSLPGSSNDTLCAQAPVEMSCV